MKGITFLTNIRNKLFQKSTVNHVNNSNDFTPAFIGNSEIYSFGLMVATGIMSILHTFGQVKNDIYTRNEIGIYNFLSYFLK